jgi:alpha-glucosidase
MYTRGKVTKYAEEIARTMGTRAYPWRVFAVARQDAELLTNSMVYLLGEPSRLTDVSWIKPGLVTLDWWPRRNLFGVDFSGGVNTATMKYLIDFAAHYGLEYMLLDCGWTKEEDLLKVSPDINMEEILAHAKKMNVRILLWAVWSTLERQWDAAFAQFSRWGISGIKIDFMNRDDQLMVNFYYRVAEETARRKMLAIFHGAYKPDGLRRTYPNVITREGLIEFEQNAVNMDDSPEYHTILPFIRMVAGPADYLPGTINNAQKHEFKMVVPRPMGQGTRAHTMALCVVLESPMRMLPDAPPDYYREDTCTRFMTEIPVEWDDLRVLHAKAGDYVVVARRTGDEWFVGGITDWDARDLDIECSFLEPGRSYTLTVIQDGINADRRAVDFKATSSTVSTNDRLRIHFAPGGGWVGRFRPQ